MNGRKARAARKMVKMFEARHGPLSFEPRHINIRHKTAPLIGVFNPDGSVASFTYTTSTQVILAKNIYRLAKRRLAG